MNWNLDYDCKTAQSDVSFEEFKLIIDCIYKNQISNYLEVGTWYGANLYKVAKIFKLNNYNIDCYGYDCFDIHEVSEDTSHTSGWPNKKIVNENLKEFSNVKIIDGLSQNINKTIKNIKFDFVFHDANHTEDSVKNDLIVLKDILNSKAYVAVHNSTQDEPSRKFFAKTAIDKLILERHYRYISSAGCSTLLQIF